MGEKSDQIERHIQEQRAELGDNIVQLQEKVKGAFDWRVQFEHRPMTMIGIALGGGVLLSSLFGGRPRSRRSRKPLDGGRTASSEVQFPQTHNGAVAAQSENKSSDAWRNIKVALVGVAGAKFQTFVDSFIPGFSKEYNKASQPDGVSLSSHDV
jgi:hypothetical protein